MKDKIPKKDRKANGLCVYCGKEKDRAETLCYECSAKRKAEAKRKIENGTCTRCGTKHDTGGWLCGECSERLRKRSKGIADSRRANNECVRCGVKIKDGLYSYCRACLDKRMEAYYKKKGVI